LLKLRTFLLHIRKLHRLIVIAGRLTVFIAHSTMFQANVIQDSTQTQPLFSVTSGCLVDAGFILKRALHFLVLWLSIYLRIVVLLTLPAVLQKYDLVHIEGIFINHGNSRLRIRDEYPFSLCIICRGENSQPQLTNKCTWSGITSRARVFNSSSDALVLSSSIKRVFISPVKTFLRLRGIQTKW
jgi:hypothetical protein